MFEVHPKLAQDCIAMGKFRLCRLLLMNDANYPWFILVPEREGVTEIYQLSHEHQQQLLRESSRFARGLAEDFGADKMNIAALGNVVPQLHIHHIVRYRNDPAWPAPYLVDVRLNQLAMPEDYQDVERRTDTLVYTTAPLADPLQITGAPAAVLFASSDARDTDWIVRLSDMINYYQNAL